MASVDSVPIAASAVYLAHSLIAVAITFVLLSSALLGARLYTRCRPGIRFGPDDWAAILAYVLATMDACVAVVSVRFSLGKHPQSFPLIELPLIGKMAFMAALLSAWAMAAIKSSVAFVLIRLKDTKRWRLFLHAMIAVQCLSALFSTIMHATRFIPLGAQWSPDPVIRADAQVWSGWAFQVAVTVVSSINIVTDIIFSLLPLTFLWDIQRPLRDKVIVGGLMALGLVGSSASIVKTIMVYRFEKSNDILAQGMRIAQWSILEEQLGLIAACVPCLKAPFQRALSRIGLITTSRARSGAHSAYINISGQSRSRHDNVRAISCDAPFFALSNDGAVLNNYGHVEGQKGIACVAQYHAEDAASSGTDAYALGSLKDKGLS